MHHEGNVVACAKIFVLCHTPGSFYLKYGIHSVADSIVQQLGLSAYIISKIDRNVPCACPNVVKV